MISRILILGGYGVFGGKLAQLLSDLPQLTLLIAGRKLEAATAFCARYEDAARMQPVRLDRHDIEAFLDGQSPDLLVDATGPFQDYGEDRYRVVEACIDAGVHYLDLADAADFVFGISAFDERARDAGVFALSGASSFPALSAAVLRELSGDMDVTGIEGGIAPSPFAGIGLNVIRAAACYAGGSIKLMCDGQSFVARSLCESRRFTISPPGLLPLGSRRFSLIDVPDLQALPVQYPALRDIWFGAGTVPEALLRMLNVAARLRAMLRLPPFLAFARLFHWALNTLTFGEHRGGMYIRATGLRDGNEVERSWHMIAEGDDGPFIPAMAIEGLVRKILSGDTPASGARPASGALSLDDYRELFAKRAIRFGFRNGENPQDPIFRQVIGEAFDGLPGQVARLHGGADYQVWKGEAKVRRGDGILSRIVCWCLNFPAAGSGIPASVTILRKGGEEVWTRKFGDTVFKSTQTLGQGRRQHLIVERFGVISVTLALVMDGDRLHYETRHWDVCGIPLPRCLMPGGDTYETEEDGKFRFDVEISAPFIGLIIAYRGLLLLEHEDD